MSSMKTSLWIGWGIMLAAIFTIIGFFVSVIFFIQAALFPWYPTGWGVTITIPEGSVVKQIAQQLKQENLVRVPLFFEMYVRLFGNEKQLKAGQFQIPEHISLRSLVRELSGLGLNQDIVVTIPEGFTQKEIAKRLAAADVVSEKEFLDTINTYEFSYSATPHEVASYSLRPWGFTLEGFLFPDTYRFKKNTPAKDIIQRMIDNFHTHVVEDSRVIGAFQKNDHLNILDVVRLASIVEAEVAHAQDRPVVAGIFEKRLDINMALQSDATLNYAIGGSSASLTSKQLAIDSPYNTYKYRGLPPTAIGNPGLDAIVAVLNPTLTNYFYFLSDKDGVTHFAATLEEHNKNKQRYLR